MAIEPPSREALANFMWLDDPTLIAPKLEWIDSALIQARDLLVLATGIDKLPDDEMQVRVIENGMLSMAEWFVATAPTRRASYSPMQSETIGSYSYSSKAAQVRAAIRSAAPTGITWFDEAVNMLRGADPLLVTTTKVFERSGNVLIRRGQGTSEVVGPAANIPPQILPSDVPEFEPGDAYGR